MLINLFEMVGGSFVIVMTLATICWTIYFFQRHAEIADIGWGLGLVFTSWIYFYLGVGDFFHKLILTLMASIWGLRLAFHLAQRLIYSEKEDPRYQRLYKNWGKENLDFKIFLMFLFQGLLIILISIPFLLVSLNPSRDWYTLEFIGIFVWLIGFIGENSADQQLTKFKKDPANVGKVCQSGLWYYSRHPNYFFEAIVWIGFFLFAFSSPAGYLGIISPILVIYLLLKVSGIPLAEEESVATRGEQYIEYQRTTSSFIPWFRKK